MYLVRYKGKESFTTGRKMNRKILSVTVVLLWATLLVAQNKDGALPIPFFDGFAQAIGGPNEAFSTGATDVFINPALMGRAKNAEIQFANLINGHDVQFFSTAMVLPLSETQFLGVGVFGLDVPVSEQYNGREYSLQYDNTFSFNVNLSYAYRFRDFSLGASVEYASSQLFPRNNMIRGTEIESSIGLYSEVNPALKLGMMLRMRNARSTLGSPALQWGGSLVWQPFTELGDRLQLLFSLRKDSGRRSDLSYAVVINPVPKKLLNARGIKSLTFRGGTANNNVVFFNIPGRRSGFYNENNAGLVGVGLGLNPIYKIELGINYCYQFNELPQSITLITTRFSF